MPEHLGGPDPTFESLRRPLEVTPPDPREIRRRAQRRSRRTAVASVAGAVLAVVAVVVPVAALTGGDKETAPPLDEPTPKSVWVRTIPADFPLGVGLPMPGEALAGMQPGKGFALQPCRDGQSSLGQSAGWVDVATATNADVVDPADGTDLRVLALYSDQSGATQALESVAQMYAECRTAQPGTAPEVVERVGGDQNAWVLRFGGSRAAFLQLVTVDQVGNALLVQQDAFQSSGGRTVEQRLADVRAGQEQVIAAMCVFAADPCSAPPTTAPPAPDQPSSTEPAVAHVEEIPGTLPLDVAYDDPGSDGEVSTPSRDGARVVFDPCGVEAFDRPEQDRLAFQVTYPEGADTREVRTYPSADDAVAQMQRLRDAVAACPRQDGTDPASAAVWSTRSVDTGYDSIAAAMTYEQGLGGGLWLFTRVGRSVLAVSVGGEYAPETVWESLAPVRDRTAKIVPSMCRFTEAGC